IYDASVPTFLTHSFRTYYNHRDKKDEEKFGSLI
ncbi:unnamed protein product, partial [marine sediment metagenome]